MIVVYDQIKALILSLRNQSDVLSFTDNGDGTYTIESTDIYDLQADFKVVLEYSDTTLNRDVIVDSISGNTFTFSGTGITEPDTWFMAIYFEQGHRIELNKKYENKAKSTNKKIQEYPLVWLYSDYEKRPSENENVSFETTLQFALVDFSQMNLYEDQRIEQKFKPVLYPYIELIDEEINRNSYSYKIHNGWGFESTINLTIFDRPFFGSDDQSKNVLPQVTDAIEFQSTISWIVEDC